MEKTDIVDEKDNVIGVSDRLTAHNNNQLHRIAAVFVFNEDGELYVQVHKKAGGLYDHSVGGHVSRGETYEEAAIREAREELGVTQHLKSLSVFCPDTDSNVHVFGLFECVAEKNWKFIPNSEVEEIIPMRIDAIRQMMFTKPDAFTRGFINTMNEYCKIKNIP